MTGKKKRLGITASAVTVVVLLSILTGTFYLPGSNRISPHTDQAFNVFHIDKIHLPYIDLGPATPKGKDYTVQFSCQNSNAPVRCYSPYQIHHAYNMQPLLDNNINGQRSTIVIIDAFQSPTILRDLKLFDKLFHLSNPNLTIIAPDGLTPFDPNNPNQVGWAGEITLDLEWAHAIAPAADIVLVLARSDADAALLSATKYAVDNNLGDVISQSFGEGEACADPKILAAEHRVFQAATEKGITLFAASGDQGAAQPTCNGSSYFLSASTPASDPLVTAVGGTYLNADVRKGTYIGEATWNDQYGVSGGGFSTIYHRPSYQKGIAAINPAGRGVPDVTYNGDVNGGVLTVWSSYGPKATPNIFIFGGTSAGSPQWAGIIALADQVKGGRLGFINGALYALGQSNNASSYFHDITVGTNTFISTDANGNPVAVHGYDTSISWDAVTGWGTPDVANLILDPIANVNSAARSHPASGL